jgi:hypothetical protein
MWCCWICPDVEKLPRGSPLFFVNVADKGLTGVALGGKRWGSPPLMRSAGGCSPSPRYPENREVNA